MKARWFARELRPAKMEFPVADLLRPPLERHRNSHAGFATMRFQVEKYLQRDFRRRNLRSLCPRKFPTARGSLDNRHYQESLRRMLAQLVGLRAGRANDD